MRPRWRAASEPSISCVTDYGWLRALASRKARFLCLPGVLVFVCACALQSPPLPALPPASATLPPMPTPMMAAPLPPAAMQAPAVAMMAMPMAMALPPAPPLPPPTDAQSLRARYGAPDFIRRDMETELWRYDGEACA